MKNNEKSKEIFYSVDDVCEILRVSKPTAYREIKKLNDELQHRDMKKYCEISGVRKIKIHELRHSHASHLIELGVSPLTISERLGHEDIKTTLNTYSHLYPNKQNEVAEMLTDFVVR